MARMNKYEARHIRNVEAYKREVQKIFDEATKEALRMGIRFDADTSKPFSFDDYPATKRKFEALMAKMHQRLIAVVRGGVDAEYELAQDSAGAQIRSVFPALSAIQISEQLRRLANSNAKAAFEQRRKRGLGLSDKVWQYTGQYKQELEMALDIGIGEGKSAQALSREVRRYLKQPNMLFRKVRDKHGVLHLSKRAKAYHPGRGVYRSSVKNALRMVATETNIAYRSADYLNTKASPWIVGIRIVLSNNHTCKDSQGVAQPFTDICDKLAGRYPKDFKFTGWHPNCRCHIEYIHKTDAEVERDTRRMLRGEKPIEAHESKNYVGELPKSFKDWYDSNKERISRSKTTPYFIEDNKKLISDGGVVISTNATTAKGTPKMQPTKLDDVFERIDKEGIEYREVKPFTTQPTDTEIIERIGGGDKTSGSCASLAFAFAANKGGLDVLDFRGGKSLEYFSTFTNLMQICDKVGGYSSFSTTGIQLMKQTQQGKLYYLVYAQHAAIVRQVGKGKYEFLELQHSTSNGWKPLDSRVFSWRFGGSGRQFGLLMDIELLQRDSGFQKMVGYINTAQADQRKGMSGTIK